MSAVAVFLIAVGCADIARRLTTRTWAGALIGVLAALATADRMPALGITDTGNLFGALEFAEKMAGEGIQPIVGQP